ncbi:NUDIX domain-containing protein [Litorimonas taeanensis]|uniref:NUDIX domain-containing protein n=1 Tax=Litorimonas taeanensis TaxID=568099 RepID=A0A420WJA9_9PROT|nr:NUDIX domain-containing protein [Litorimonas taeanensis]RKQ71016.1 NUDIX domain-containing protein [Litorimonas taeanensis]
MLKAIKTIKVTPVYENDFVSVYDNDVLFPSGKKGSYFRTQWKAPYGVAILPIYMGQALLINTYRYAELSHSLEVPQGFGTEGSTPVEDARRELSEEIGAKGEDFLPIGKTGKAFETYLFQTTLPEKFSPAFNNVEDTESISGVKLFSLNTLKNTSFEDLGIFDAVTQICLLKFINHV